MRVSRQWRHAIEEAVVAMDNEGKADTLSVDTGLSVAVATRLSVETVATGVNVEAVEAIESENADTMV